MHEAFSVTRTTNESVSDPTPWFRTRLRHGRKHQARSAGELLLGKQSRSGSEPGRKGRLAEWNKKLEDKPPELLWSIAPPSLISSSTNARFGLPFASCTVDSHCSWLSHRIWISYNVSHHCLEKSEYRSMTRRCVHGRKVNFGRWLCIATRRKGFGSVQGLGAFLRPCRYHVAGCANLN